MTRRENIYVYVHTDSHTHTHPRSSTEKPAQPTFSRAFFIPLPPAKYFYCQERQTHDTYFNPQSLNDTGSVFLYSVDWIHCITIQITPNTTVSMRWSHFFLSVNGCLQGTHSGSGGWGQSGPGSFFFPRWPSLEVNALWRLKVPYP